MRVVLDTNVLLAAYLSRGLCAEILDHCILRRWLVLSPSILEEFQDKLIHKFLFPENESHRLIMELKKESLLVTSKPFKVPGLRDRKDEHVIATAIEAQADIIVSGDKDLLVLKDFKKTRIMSPRDFWLFYQATGGI